MILTVLQGIDEEMLGALTLPECAERRRVCGAVLPTEAGPDCSSAADSLICGFGICGFGDIGISPKHPYNVRVRIKSMADFSLGAIGKSWSQHRANSMSSTRWPTSAGRTRADIEAHLTEANTSSRARRSEAMVDAIWAAREYPSLRPRLLLLLSPAVVDFDRRGFRSGPFETRAALEAAASAFVAGFNAELAMPPGVAAVLEDLPEHRRGFGAEGAGMAAGLLDLLNPVRGRRLATLRAAHDARYAYLIYVGVGWAMAKLRRRRLGSLLRDAPLLRWLAYDGMGFCQAFFAGPRQLQRWVRIRCAAIRLATSVIRASVAVCGSVRAAIRRLPPRTLSGWRRGIVATRGAV